jgi:4-amino-4-deoxychorismate lyase
MSLLVETIKIADGIPLNLEYHNERLKRTVKDLFGKTIDIDLEKYICVPSFAMKGIFRCRIEYDFDIRKTEYLPYYIKEINSLKIIEGDDIEYRYKYVDRSRINALAALCGANEDFLLIKNNLVTDTSCANIIFKNSDGEWYTPDSYLLQGTKRASILKNGIIKETRITVSDIKIYSEAKLINAMIDINDTIGIPVSRIRF